jgi:NHLM bacteriocin system ABC transporter ATP-binding protein
MSVFGSFFTEAATAVPRGMVRLDDVRRTVLVEEGALDLFAVRLHDGEPTGRWSFLCRAERGALLVGSSFGPGHRIVGRPVPDSLVSTVPLDHLRELTGTTIVSPGIGEATSQFLRGLEAGVAALDQALRDELPPRDFAPLSAGGITPVGKGHSVRSVDGVLWVHVESGAVRTPSGMDGQLGAGSCLCVTEADWLVADAATELRARRSAELLVSGELWSRLVTHASRVLHTIDRRVARRDEVERSTLARQATRDAQSLQAAARGFEAVLRDTEARVPLAEVAADPEPLAAARLVASYLGFNNVRAPVTAENRGRRMSPIQRIAQVSGFRTRTIRLDEGWWRQSQGPMVGFVTGAPIDPEQPVALLPDRGGYVVARTTENRVEPVTADIARTLERRALVFYRPLPADVRGAGKLLRFAVRSSRRDIAMIAAMGVLIAGLGLLAPILTGAILGNFVAHARTDLVVEGSLLVIGSAFIAALLSIVQNIAALRLEGRSTGTLQASVWARMLTLPASFFSRYSTGELGMTVLGVSAVQETLSTLLTTAALGFMAGLANLILVFFYDVRLALVATVLVAIGAGVCAVAGVFEVRVQRQIYQHEQSMSARVFQILSGVPKLRVAAAEDRAFAVWAGHFARGRRLVAGSRRVQNQVTTFNAAFPLMCSLVIFAVVGGPLHGSISLSTFLAFFTAFALLTAATVQFTSVAITAMNVVPMLEQLDPILAAEPEENVEKADPGDLSGHVAFSHVSFQYGEDGPRVLDDVSFTAEPGEFVAVVGSTGSGKSTILRILMGFETPTSGSVLYDGQDLGELDVTAVRRQCGVVLQNGSLLAGDIRTNIIGGTNHTIDDAWEAARMVGIDEEIAAMPMGMFTVVSEGTNTLSGGQRQRIMIARALVSRPRLVFFDEATSALDNPAQRVVAESTHNLNATRIVIAHRLSTIIGADRIIVLDRGRIAQQGSYDELLADRDGIFARLARHQVSAAA